MFTRGTDLLIPAPKIVQESSSVTAATSDLEFGDRHRFPTTGYTAYFQLFRQKQDIIFDPIQSEWTSRFSHVDRVKWKGDNEDVISQRVRAPSRNVLQSSSRSL